MQDSTAEDSPIGAYQSQMAPITQPPLDVDDNSSDLEDFDVQSLITTTTSLASSIAKGVWEHGRRYNRLKEGEYYLPNDEQEMDGLDMQHAMVLLMCDDQLHFADIGAHPQQILE